MVRGVRDAALYLLNERFGERRRHTEQAAGRDTKGCGSDAAGQPGRRRDGGRDHDEERTDDDEPMRQRGAVVAAGR